MTSNHLSGRMTISHGLIYFYTPEVQLNCHMSPVLTSDHVDTTRPAHSNFQEVTYGTFQTLSMKGHRSGL